MGIQGLASSEKARRVTIFLVGSEDIPREVRCWQMWESVLPILALIPLSVPSLIPALFILAIYFFIYFLFLFFGYFYVLRGAPLAGLSTWKGKFGAYLVTAGCSSVSVALRTISEEGVLPTPTQTPWVFDEGDSPIDVTSMTQDMAQSNSHPDIRGYRTCCSFFFFFNIDFFIWLCWVFIASFRIFHCCAQTL